MGGVPFAASAVLLAPVSTAPEEGGKSPASPKSAARARGSPVQEPTELEKFFQLNPEEKFDLEATNLIDAPKLVEEARGDKRVLREVLRTAEALLPRVRAETEDPLLVSAILRNKTMDWVRHSPSDSSWGDTMPLRWGGIFYESRVPGGRLCRKLSTRLAGLITLCVEASGAVAFLRAGVTGLFRGSAMMAKMVQFGLSSKRPRQVQQVAQAYLDDLAANRCVGKQSLPLERLSEAARRNGSAEVNITLVELFSQEGTGTLIVLDPRFHPGMDPVTIRVVPPKSQDDAATYDLVHGGVQAVRESASSEDAAAEATPASTWERLDMGKKEWLGLFKSLAKRKERLETPRCAEPFSRSTGKADRVASLSSVSCSRPARWFRSSTRTRTTSKRSWSISVKATRTIGPKTVSGSSLTDGRWSVKRPTGTRALTGPTASRRTDGRSRSRPGIPRPDRGHEATRTRSEEHTSELQS